MTARIGYENLLAQSGATVTAESEDGASVVENAFDWREYDSWKPSTDGDSYIDLELAAADNADYCALAWHTLGTNGARAQWFYGDGSDWFPAGYSVDDPAGAAYVMEPSGSRVVYEQFGVLRENLLSWSQDFSQSDWLKASTTVTSNDELAPDGTYTADRLTSNGAAYPNVRQIVDLPAGQTACFSVYVKEGDSTRFYIRVDGAAGERAQYNFQWSGGVLSYIQAFFDEFSNQGYSLESISGGWYRVSIYVVLDSGGETSFTCYSNYNNTNILFHYLWGAQVEIGQATASEYQPTTGDQVDNGAQHWRCKFYSKHNLLTYSEQLDNAAWAKTRASITANAAIAPDGTTTADKLIEDSSTGSHFIQQSVIFDAGAWYAFSLYAKAGERSEIELATGSVAFGFNASVKIDLLSQSVIDSNAVGASIADAGDGWCRISFLLYAISTASTAFYCNLRNGVLSYAGDGTSGLFVWGGQIEKATSAGPYQVTTSAAVTDNAIGQVGHLALGESLALGGLRPGFTPPGMIEQGEAINSLSEDGKFLGRSVRVKGEMVQIDQTVVSASWPRTYLDDFATHALRYPYVFAWDLDNYPTEVVMMVPPEDGGVQRPSYSNTQLMEFSIRAMGWRE